jgi:hypothetical protein
MSSHKRILPEYLGDIDPELMLQNLTNINPHVNSINEIRFGLAQMGERGKVLTVSAAFEYAWDGNPKTTIPVAKRFVGLGIAMDEIVTIEQLPAEIPDFGSATPSVHLDTNALMPGVMTHVNFAKSIRRADSPTFLGVDALPGSPCQDGAVFHAVAGNPSQHSRPASLEPVGPESRNDR